jgi:hypothetical protein
MIADGCIGRPRRRNEVNGDSVLRSGISAQWIALIEIDGRLPTCPPTIRLKLLDELLFVIRIREFYSAQLADQIMSIDQ